MLFAISFLNRLKAVCKLIVVDRKLESQLARNNNFDEIGAISCRRRFEQSRHLFGIFRRLFVLPLGGFDVVAPIRFGGVPSGVKFAQPLKSHGEA